MSVRPLVVKEVGCRSSDRLNKSHLFTGLLDRLSVLRVWFKKKLVERLDQRYIKPIEPDNRFSRVVRMIMPGQLRRQDQVAFLHHALLTINRGVGAASFEDKAERGSRVPVRPSVLTRLHILKRKLNGVCGRLTIAERRIQQTNCASLSLFHTDYFTSSHQAFVNIFPFPKARMNGRLRVWKVAFKT